MKTPRLVKTLTWATVILVGVGFLFPVFFPWSPIYCEHQDIDLTTGRARFTQMRFFIPVETRYEHTSISEELGISELTSPTGDWKRVNTFSPGVHHSPHYSYHGALSQAYDLGLMWQVTEFTDDARKESALTVLRLWRESGRDSGARKFLTRLRTADHDVVTLTDVNSIGDTENMTADSTR